jgi:hypothetical protein
MMLGTNRSPPPIYESPPDTFSHSFECDLGPIHGDATNVCQRVDAPSGDRANKRKALFAALIFNLIALRLRLRAGAPPRRAKTGARRGPQACGARNYLEIIHYRRPEGVQFHDIPEGLLHPVSSDSLEFTAAF